MEVGSPSKREVNLDTGGLLGNYIRTAVRA